MPRNYSFLQGPTKCAVDTKKKYCFQKNVIEERAFRKMIQIVCQKFDIPETLTRDLLELKEQQVLMTGYEDLRSELFCQLSTG